jgi:hypothetical protein
MIIDELKDATSRKRTIDEEYLKICKNLGIVPASYYLQHIQDSQLSLKHHGLGPKGARALAESLKV